MIPTYSNPTNPAIATRISKLKGIAGFDCFPRRRGIINSKFAGDEFWAIVYYEGSYANESEE
jgi:hypothetical protein